MAPRRTCSYRRCHIVAVRLVWVPLCHIRPDCVVQQLGRLSAQTDIKDSAVYHRHIATHCHTVPDTEPLSQRCTGLCAALVWCPTQRNCLCAHRRETVGASNQRARKSSYAPVASTETPFANTLSRTLVSSAMRENMATTRRAMRHKHSLTSQNVKINPGASPPQVTIVTGALANAWVSMDSVPNQSVDPYISS